MLVLVFLMYFPNNLGSPTAPNKTVVGAVGPRRDEWADRRLVDKIGVSLNITQTKTAARGGMEEVAQGEVGRKYD